MGKHPVHVVGTVLGLSLCLSLVGCDYWPPALQAQIEQLRSETQALTMEKSQIQAQLHDLSKAKTDLQEKVDELSRNSHEKTAMIASLQNQLDAARARYLKAVSPKASAKFTGKSAGRSPHKGTAGVPMNKKPAPRSIGVR
jgi:predicted  nucleic acid-binding Zn-ribbon protein